MKKTDELELRCKECNKEVILSIDEIYEKLNMSIRRITYSGFCRGCSTSFSVTGEYST